MFLSILFSSLLGLSPGGPSDSIPFSQPVSGGGMLLGAQVSLIDPQAFKLGFGPAVGYYRFRDINDRLTFQIEFQAKLVSGYHISALFEDNVVNPAGLSVSNASFNLRSLLFFEMPVLLKFRQNRTARHQYFAGFRPSMNALTSYPGGNTSISVSNNAFPSDFSQLSLRDAVRPFDLGIIAGWSYAFSRRLSFDVRYTQGLFDLTADNFFKSNANTFNTDLQVSLRASF